MSKPAFCPVLSQAAFLVPCQGDACMWFIDAAAKWESALEGAPGGWCAKAAPAEVLGKVYWLPKPVQDNTGRPMSLNLEVQPDPLEDIAAPAPMLVDPTQTPIESAPTPVGGPPKSSLPDMDVPSLEVWVLPNGHNRALFPGDDERLPATMRETASMYGTFGDYSGGVVSVAVARWPNPNGAGIDEALVWSCWSMTAMLHVVLGLRSRVWPADRPSEVAGEAARQPQVTLRRADTGTWISVDAGDEFLNPAMAAIMEGNGNDGVAGRLTVTAAPDLTLVNPDKPVILSEDMTAPEA